MLRLSAVSPVLQSGHASRVTAEYWAHASPMFGTCIVLLPLFSLVASLVTPPQIWVKMVIWDVRKSNYGISSAPSPAGVTSPAEGHAVLEQSIFSRILPHGVSL